MLYLCYGHVIACIKQHLVGPDNSCLATDSITGSDSSKSLSRAVAGNLKPEDSDQYDPVALEFKLSVNL